MTNLRSLLLEASAWMYDHWPELPNADTIDLKERIDAALSTDEPKVEPEREGMKFGCCGCDAVVTLAFTDSTKQYVDIRSVEGWTAGVGGTWCPKCTSRLNREVKP